MYLALRGGPRRFTRAFPDPALLGNTFGRSFAFVYGAITLCGAPFQSASTSNRLCNSLRRLPPSQKGPTTPSQHRRQAVPLRRFRLDPVSLAATQGVAVAFFSSGYLDVSVLPVRLHIPMYSGWDTLAGGFPHSDIHGSKLGRQLPVAFRSHPRPSSASGAKASTVGSL